MELNRFITLTDGEITLKVFKIGQEDLSTGWLPAYHFNILNKDNRVVGQCDLRIGHNSEVYFGGNIGYTIYEPYRGNHYAGKAVKLLLDLAKQHDLGFVILSCNPDNIASIKTCEYVGARYLETVNVPNYNPTNIHEEKVKRIYRIKL